MSFGSEVIKTRTVENNNTHPPPSTRQVDIAITTSNLFFTFTLYLPAAVYLPFDTITDGEFKDGTKITNTTLGMVQTVDGMLDQALYLDGQTVISLGEGRDECFMNPELCTNGFTMAFWVLNIDKNVSCCAKNGNL